MRTLRDLSVDIEKKLVVNSIDDAKLDTRLLISHVLKIDHIDYALNKNRIVSEKEYTVVMQLVAQRLKRVPMSQIFGEKEFWGRSFKVSSGTLTPRPDSETLIKVALSTVQDKREVLNILDLGTGTGCLMLTLLCELKNASGLAIDISKQALEVAQDNAHSLKLMERVRFACSDWTNNLGKNKKFDLIISNPPYIGLKEKEGLAPEVRDHEPERSLFSGPKGLDDYKKIASQVEGFMTKDATIILEIGYKQARDVKKIFSQNGFSNIAIHQDLAGRDRCLLIKK